MYGPLVMASPEITDWDQAEFALNSNLDGLVLNGADGADGTNGNVYTMTLEGKTFYPDYYMTERGTHYLRLNLTESD